MSAKRSSGVRCALTLGALGLLGTGCGTFVTVTPLYNGAVTGGPRPPETVQILTSGPPQRPYIDVALLEVEQTESFNAQGTDVMLAELREKAGQLGCDAVVITGTSAHEGDDDLWPLDHDRRGLLASCVVYTGSSEGRAAGAAAPR